MNMPPIGLGLAHWSDPSAVREAVETALDIGYRHIDTAQAYDNESGVGEAIEESSVPRDELLVSTKVHEQRLTYDGVIDSTRQSLDRLGLDTIDLLYVHTPRLQGCYEPEETLPAFDALRDRGLIEHIGVANFSPGLLAEARDVLDAPLFAHQVEMHPLLPQNQLLTLSEQNDYHLVAHTPIIRGDVVDIPELVEIAEMMGATPVQVSLAWLRQRGAVPIPGAIKGEHLRENHAAMELNLGPDAMDQINSLEAERRICDWDDGPWNWTDGD